jgi:hypothetical protein
MVRVKTRPTNSLFHSTNALDRLDSLDPGGHLNYSTPLLAMAMHLVE